MKIEDGFLEIKESQPKTEIADSEVLPQSDELEEPLCNSTGLTEEQLIKGTLFSSFVAAIMGNHIQIGEKINYESIVARAKKETDKIYSEYEKQKLD
jgi:hypothetical protein